MICLPDKNDDENNVQDSTERFEKSCNDKSHACVVGNESEWSECSEQSENLKTFISNSIKTIYYSDERQVDSLN